MRIATFSVALPIPDRKPAGVDVMLERLARELVSRGHDVRLYSFLPAPADAPYDYVAMKPRSFADGKVRRMAFASLSLNGLNLRDRDVFHLHGDDWFYFRRQLPTVRTFYGSALFEARHAVRLRRRFSQSVGFGLELLAARLATRTYSLVPREDDSLWYGTSGALEFGQDVDEAASTTAKESRPTILFVGHWNGRKRGRMLAEAFASAVRPRLPDAQLWMVSDFAEGDGVKWIQRPSDEELADLYRRAWVFCLPSSYEGLGVPYLEALARRMPVVATPNIGANYVLQAGRAGLICRDDELGDSLHRVLVDDKLRAQLSEAAVERIGHFRWDRIVELHESAYLGAIDDWAHRRRP